MIWDKSGKKSASISFGFLCHILMIVFIGVLIEAYRERMMIGDPWLYPSMFLLAMGFLLPLGVILALYILLCYLKKKIDIYPTLSFILLCLSWIPILIFSFMG